MKTAFVLSGGGAKGAFQVGAMLRMHELGIRPDVIYGTSVGALNAACYAYQGIEGLHREWAGVRKKSDVLSRNWLSVFWRSGFYSMKPLLKHLEDVVVGDPICEAKVCKVSLKTGEIKIVSNLHSNRSEFIMSTLGSSSIPFVMESVDGEWVDGGVRRQTPLKEAIVVDGCTKIYALICNPIVQNPEQYWESSFPYPLSHGFRALDLMEHEIFLHDLHRAVEYNNDPTKIHVDLTMCSPDRQMIDTLEFDPVKIKTTLDHGYEIAKRVLG